MEDVRVRRDFMGLLSFFERLITGSQCWEDLKYLYGRMFRFFWTSLHLRCGAISSDTLDISSFM